MCISTLPCFTPFSGALLTFSLNIIILWTISTTLTLSLFGYAAFATTVLVISGRNLVRIDYDQLRYEADFRYGLVHVRDNAESIASLLNRARMEIEQEDILCDVLEKEGKPAFVICDVADDLNVDLIVMGTRGLNLEEDQESTAARVIQLAPCPVLVVP